MSTSPAVHAQWEARSGASVWMLREHGAARESRSSRARARTGYFVQPNRTWTSKVDAPPCVVRPLPWSFVRRCARIIQASPLREWARGSERPSFASHLLPPDGPPVSVMVGVCTCVVLSKPKDGRDGGNAMARGGSWHPLVRVRFSFKVSACPDLGSQLRKGGGG